MYILKQTTYNRKLGPELHDQMFNKIQEDISLGK